MGQSKYQERILNRIVSKRKSTGYSQEYIAECLGMGQANYCKIEAGIRNMKIETFFKLAKILKLDLNELIDKIEVEKCIDANY